MVTEDRKRLIQQPSLVHLAADAIRDMILSGELLPGDRLIEERLSEQLGVSRPPLREALRLLESEELLISVPRRGMIVQPLTVRDVYELFTLRATYERMAVNLGVPVRHPARLDRMRQALETMAEAARREDRAKLVAAAFEFHLALVALAGHRRLEEAYRRLWLQLRLCMAVNTRVREKMSETLEENVERHRRLLAIMETGDRDAVLAALEVHGDRAFMKDLVEQFQDSGSLPADTEPLFDVLALGKTALESLL